MMKQFFCMVFFCMLVGNIYGNSLAGRGGFSSLGKETAERERLEIESQRKLKMMEEVQKMEKEDKQKREEISERYDREVRDLFETESFDSGISFQENIEKCELTTIEVENITEATILAEKKASKDGSYINRQIDMSNELTMYKISSEFPFHINDPKYPGLKTKKFNYPLIDYSKTFPVDYPVHGISATRHYLFISPSKNRKDNSNIKIEKGGIVFIEKGLDLNVDTDQLHIVSVSGKVSNDTVKSVINKHNKKIEESEKKINEKYGIKDDAKPAKQNSNDKKSTSPARGKNNPSSNTNSNDTGKKTNDSSVKSRSDLMKGLPNRF